MKKRLLHICMIIACVISLSGCAFLESKFKEWKGELIGNSFTVSVYDNFGNNILNIKGDKIQAEGNEVKVSTLNSDGTYSTTYELSSVITNTIDGHNMETTGNTVIYAEKGLNQLYDFELDQTIQTSGGTFNLLDRNINEIKNKLGTPKVVIVSSQLGVPLAVYGGDSVYWEIPDDLPKMTRLNIDGKALYIHRANYIILDTAMID